MSRMVASGIDISKQKRVTAKCGLAVFLRH